MIERGEGRLDSHCGDSDTDVSGTESGYDERMRLRRRGDRTRAMYVLSRAGTWSIVLRGEKGCGRRVGGWGAFDHLCRFRLY